MAENRTFQTYSFTKPRVKYFLSQEIRLVLFFFSMSLLILFVTYGALLYKTHSFYEDTKKYQLHSKELNVSIAKVSADIEYIYTEETKAKDVYTNNSVLKDSIHNLFDLVPNRIILSSAKLDKYSLILQGKTPTQQMYNFRLRAPLESLFHESYSTFYPAENGWYYFVSKNYLDKDEGLK